MTTQAFDQARWIARPVPAGTRIIRELQRSRIDWAEPGQALAQTFRTDGPITAVNLDVAGPRGVADPHAADVRFAIVLETVDGAVVAERVVEGPQLVWDYFGQLLDVSPPAPAGEYAIVLKAERGTIGWWTAESRASEPDDGVSPLPVAGSALADGRPVAGTRLIGVDTMPAPNPVFRRTVELADVPETATLDAVVLGCGVIRINGVKVGREALEPAVTDYDHSILYRTWEVAQLLRAGTNELIIEAGRERFAARGGDVWGWSLAPWHREPMALARLVATSAAGESTVVVTDGSWQAAAGEVVAERLFRGEDRVLRAGDLDWGPVAEVAAPAGALRIADLPPVRALAPLAARSVDQLDERSTVYDFGEVMVGRIRCLVTGQPGAAVTVRSGEQRAADGSVLCDNTLVAGEAQLDTLTLEVSADGYVWEPQFGYRGFRWMQVDLTGDVRVEQVRAIPLYTELDRVGELWTEDPLFGWIDTATARTFRNNMHGIPTDTPIYEKNGWTADAHLATEGLLHHFDLRATFGKWMHDHADAQSIDGAVPQIIPTPGWGRASDPAWSSSAVLVPWYLYREYGDRGILERSRPMVGRFAEQIIKRLGGGLWPDRTWGDWLSPGHMTGPEGMAPIGTITAVMILQRAAAIFRELGEPGAEHFDDAAQQTANAYHHTYFDEATGSYAVPGVGYRQSLNILPLAFDAVPAEHVAAVRAGLIRDLEERTDGHLDCGAVGVRHLLPVLSDAGREDLAITVLTRRTRPGWGVWFDDGESTLLESWDVDARSRNHYFLGSVAAWIQQRVGGLRLTEPGWQRFEVAPVDDPRVIAASIRHRTPLGDAAVDWERGHGGWLFSITVPKGSTARVSVPDGDEELSAGSHVVRFAARSSVV